jgi:dUTP pyrophosphatase
MARFARPPVPTNKKYKHRCCFTSKIAAASKMLLKIYVQNEEMRPIYEAAIEKHNMGINTDPYPNAGFDLFMQSTPVIFSKRDETRLVSLEIKTEMRTNEGKPTGYYLYPRSCLSRTPLSLANHVGIVDSGYRGSIIAAFRCSAADEYTVEPFSRLVQICAPNLAPFRVVLVDSEDELSSTKRGEGGFGSTGK